MELKAYSIYDTESKHFDVPFFCKEHMFAKRHFQIVYENNEMIKSFITKFEIHYIGSFNPENGKLTQIDKTFIILTGIEFMKMTGGTQ